VSGLGTICSEIVKKQVARSAIAEIPRCGVG